MSRPQIFIGDLLNALDALAIKSPATARAVMRMLSLESLQDETTAAPTAPPPPTPAVDPKPGAGFAPTQSPTDTKSERSNVAAQDDLMETSMTRLAADTAPRERPAWLAATTALPRAVPTYEAPLDPLFDPRQARALLAGLVASSDDDGAIDIDRLLERLARREAIRELPTLRSFSLRRGVQVLIDDGATMAPFARDTAHLIAALRALLPAQLMQWMSFAGSPLRGCRSAGSPQLARWRPPCAGTAVLVVSDLGLGRPDYVADIATGDEWRRFADTAAAAGVAVRTLVPYAPKRWPKALAAQMRAVHWDRRTSAAVVRRTLTVAS